MLILPLFNSADAIDFAYACASATPCRLRHINNAYATPLPAARALPRVAMAPAPSIDGLKSERPQQEDAIFTLLLTAIISKIDMLPAAIVDIISSSTTIRALIIDAMLDAIVI